MKNKGFVIALSAVITLLCIYYLSFTLVSHRIKKEATEYATNGEGVVDLEKRQHFFDSIWNKPVYRLAGRDFTFKEVKDQEMNLGLDLQGGMHVTLEISPADIITGLIGDVRAPSVQAALKKANDSKGTSKEDFVDRFFANLKLEYPERKLASWFQGPQTRGRIKAGDSDSQVVDFVKGEVESAIDRSYIILRKRLDQFGTSSPNIQRLAGTRNIQVEIPGADNPQRIRNLLQGVAKLEFLNVVEPETPALRQSIESINRLLAAEEVRTIKPPTLQDSITYRSELEEELALSETPSKDSLVNAGVSSLLSLSDPPGSFHYHLNDTATINRIFKRGDVQAVLKSRVGVFWANKPDQVNGRDGLQLYFLDIHSKQKLDGDVINAARADVDEYQRPAVSMVMNATGSRTWMAMTRDAAARTPRGRIAIVLDKTVYSAPVVNGEIPNGNSQIAGNFTTEEAKDLANVLRAGSLPATCRIVEEAIIGPTLGQTAQQEGIISSLCGLVLVVIFMVGYYSKGGWIANLALLFNMFFIIGILAQPSLGTALTLPGIAGIVLTMGMAVDANVLIYERIKEEIRRGVHIKEAVNKGFKRAFASIFDSNLTTLLTGVCLFLFGQGPIKGFAVPLVIGIVTSFFTAIYISRVFIEWMLRRSDPEKISFETPISSFVRRRGHIDFLTKSKVVFGVSVSFIAAGFITLAINGFNLGVDFKGGRAYIVSFKQPVVATDLKLALTNTFNGAGTEVKNYGSNNVMKVTTSYLIDDNTEAADNEVKRALISGLETANGLKYVPEEQGIENGQFTISSSSKVGATVAQDIKSSAWQASIVSLVGIFLYILLRFKKWQYSAGAILATIHDALFVIAAFAIADAFGLSFEIDQIFIAALLTVIGYSLNDTVIIYDRIRENLGFGASHDRVKIVNDALNETLSRTIITSGTTLLVVLVLLIFGGEVLRGFSFALLIGILVGTYSSIYIAAPAVLELESQAVTAHSLKPKVNV
jgi:SecD/SecF fusion protein